MLRTFRQYRPRQIALYVKAFFRGKLYIAGIGAFDFDGGRLLLPSMDNRPALMVMKEVNKLIKEMSLI